MFESSVNSRKRDMKQSIEEKTREFIINRESPYGPWVCLEKKRMKAGFPEIALLFDARPLSREEFKEGELQLYEDANYFDDHDKLTKMKPKLYDSVDQLLADGWILD